MNIWRCPNCFFRLRLKDDEFPFTCKCGRRYEYPVGIIGQTPVQKEIAKKKREKGVGGFLADIFSEMEVSPKMGCGCKLLMRKMDSLGPEGCKEKMVYFIHQLERKSKLYNWRDKVNAAISGAMAGIVVLNILHPFKELIELAIKRYELHQVSVGRPPAATPE